MFRSLSFRLIFATLIGFLLSLSLAAALVFKLLDSYLIKQMDEQLITQALDLGASLESVWHHGQEGDLKRLMEHYALRRGASRQFALLWGADDQLMAQSDLSDWADMPRHPPVAGSDLFVWADWVGEAHHSGVRVLTFRSPAGFTLQIGQDQGERMALLKRGRWLGMGTLLAVLLVGSLIGAVFTRRALAGVFQLKSAAEQVSVKMDLANEVDLPTGSLETDQVAIAFNQMLGRIQELLEFHKSSLDNIAHDVRSPVTRLRAIAESALNDSHADWAGRVIGECDQILNLVDLMLEISAAEAGIPNWNWSEIDPAEAVTTGCELFEPLFEAHGIEVVCLVESGQKIRTDARVWQRVVANLLDNAIKFNQPGGRVQVKQGYTSNTTWFEFMDTGEGISADQLGQVFNRFERGDHSRSTRGSGLGLAFCRASIEAMGGRISCESEIGEGSVFRVTLPTLSLVSG